MKYTKRLLPLITLLALGASACGESEDPGLVPMSTGGMTSAGSMAGTMAAGTVAAGTTTAGTTGAGSTAGTSGAGTMTAGDDMGGSTVVPPMDDIGRCFEGCLNFLACEPNGLSACGNASLAAFAATCQSQCMVNTAGVNAATAAGCGSEVSLLGSLGLTCIDETLCDEVDCPGGTCTNGQCTPFMCASDVYDADGNDGQDRATNLSFEPLIATNLTLCAGDRDWYFIEIPAGASLRIDLGFQHALADIDVKVYDEAMAQLLSSASGNDNERLTFPPSDIARRIWFEVYVYSSRNSEEMGEAAPSGTYDLYISTNLPAPICQTVGNCGDGDLCLRDTGVCAPPPPCVSDDECGSGVCDIPSGRCIDCYTTEDCFSGVCNTATNECVSCLANPDCAEGTLNICNPETFLCVECLSDGDCVDGTCNESQRCIPNSCNDPQEPDNDLASATPLSFNGGVAEITGQSCGDDDFFTFTATGGENLLVSLLFTDEAGDIEMSITDPAGASFTRTTSSDNEILGYPNAIPGEYQIRVYSFNFQINQYTLRVEQNAAGQVCNADDQCGGGTCDSRESALCLPAGYCDSNRDCEPELPVCELSTNQCKSCSSDPFEPNNDSASAIPAQSVGGNLNTCGGPDFFAVEAAPGRTINVTVSFTHMTGDIDLRLYDQALEIVASSGGTSDNEEISYLAEMGGVYFIEVYGFRDVYNEYTLNVAVQ